MKSKVAVAITALAVCAVAASGFVLVEAGVTLDAGSGSDTPADGKAVEAAVLAFDVEDVACWEDRQREDQIGLSTDGGRSLLNLTQTVRLAEGSAGLTAGALTVGEEGVYRLETTSERGRTAQNESENTCTRAATYDAVVQLPATGSFELVIAHDGRAVAGAVKDGRSFGTYTNSSVEGDSQPTPTDASAGGSGGASGTGEGDRG